MPILLLIGVGAGLVSAVLFASASSGTVLGVLVLFFLSPLPVAIAGLGWGWMPAAMAAAFGCVLVGVLGTGRAAVFYALTLGLPTAVMSYLIMLNRPLAWDRGAPSATLEWYPVGHLLAWAALWAGCLAAAGLLTTAADLEGLRSALKANFERFLASGGALPGMPSQGLGENQLDVFVELMVVSFAGAIATLWMGVATLNLWVAGQVTRISSRLQRPWPDLTGIELPRRLPLAFAVAVAATFLPDLVGLIASGFASAMLFAYMLVGLAIIHQLTRGMTSRPLVLGAVYAALLFLSPFSNLLLALAGIAEPFSPLRRPPAPPSPPMGQISNR
jgi:hypothetical protein